MLYLRPFARSDMKWLLGQFPDARSLRLWTGNHFRFPLERSQLRAHMKLVHCRYPKYRFFTARDSLSDDIVGYGELSRIGKERSAFLSRILVAQSHRNRGIGTELLRQLLAIGFHTFSLHRIELNVYDFNIAAIRCYENAGLRKEGLLRDTCFTGLDFWSEYRMSVLASEWAKRDISVSAE